MHPREYFDGNPFHEDGKTRKSRSAGQERSKSAPGDKKPFKYSSPGKHVSHPRRSGRTKKRTKGFLSRCSSSVETKTAASINSLNEARKICTWSVRRPLRWRMKRISTVKRSFRINFPNHVPLSRWSIRTSTWESRVKTINKPRTIIEVSKYLRPRDERRLIKQPFPETYFFFTLALMYFSSSFFASAYTYIYIQIKCTVLRVDRIPDVRRVRVILNYNPEFPVASRHRRAF